MKRKAGYEKKSQRIGTLVNILQFIHGHYMNIYWLPSDDLLWASVGHTGTEESDMNFALKEVSCWLRES